MSSSDSAGMTACDRPTACSDGTRHRPGSDRLRLTSGASASSCSPSVSPSGPFRLRRGTMVRPPPVPHSGRASPTNATMTAKTTAKRMQGSHRRRRPALGHELAHQRVVRDRRLRLEPSTPSARLSASSDACSSLRGSARPRPIPSPTGAGVRSPGAPRLGDLRLESGARGGAAAGRLASRCSGAMLTSSIRNEPT